MSCSGKGDARLLSSTEDTRGAGTNIDRLTHRKEDSGCWVEGRGRWGHVAGHALTEGVQLGTSQWLTLGVLF